MRWIGRLCCSCKARCMFMNWFSLDILEVRVGDVMPPKEDDDWVEAGEEGPLGEPA